MTDLEFLTWIRNRLVNVYGEDKDTDFVLRLNKIIEAKMNRFEEFVKIAYAHYVKVGDMGRAAVLAISSAQAVEQELRKYEEAEKEKERDEARKVLNKVVGTVEVPSIHHIYPWHAAPNAAVAAYTNKQGDSFWLCVRANIGRWEIRGTPMDMLIVPASEWATSLEIRPNK